MKFEISYRLVDSYGESTTLKYTTQDITSGADDGDRFVVAQGIATGMKTALEAVTDALVAEVTIKNVHASSNSIPLGDLVISKEATLNVHLNPPAVKAKTAPLRIPLPQASIFSTDGVTLDTADADLVAFVTVHADNLEISDGEVINQASGDDGMESGYLRTKARSYKK